MDEIYWVNILAKLPKPFRFQDALRAGIHRDTLRRLKVSGRVEQLTRGLYQVTNSGELKSLDLAIVFRRIPDSVLCMVSALYFHKLGTQIPHEVSIAIPRRSRIPKLEYPPTKVYRVAEQYFAVGIEKHKIDGQTIQVYTKARTLVDCFKYRHKIGLDVALEALKEYCRQPDFQLSLILEIAQCLRVERVMQPYLEALA